MKFIRISNMATWFKENIDVIIVRQYVESVLETSGDDFESTDDLYEAIGEVRCLAKVLVASLTPVFWQVLHEMEEDKSEKEIR